EPVIEQEAPPIGTIDRRQDPAAGRATPATGRGTPRRSPAWLPAALVLLGTGLQLVRGPGVPVWRAVFGEDGGIFLTEALASRGWSGLLTPYQGYVQLASRAVAEVAATFPLGAAAVVLAVGSALIVSLL